MSRSATTIVRGGRALAIRRRSAELADVLIRGGALDAPGPPGLPAPDDASVIDASRRLIVPGLFNAHTHGPGAPRLPRQAADGTRRRGR